MFKIPVNKSTRDYTISEFGSNFAGSALRGFIAENAIKDHLELPLSFNQGHPDDGYDLKTLATNPELIDHTLNGGRYQQYTVDVKCTTHFHDYPSFWSVPTHSEAHTADYFLFVKYNDGDSELQVIGAIRSADLRKLGTPIYKGEYIAQFKKDSFCDGYLIHESKLREDLAYMILGVDNLKNF